MRLGKMRDWGKTIAMDLIRGIIVFFGSQGMRQPVTENPRVPADLPLTRANLVRAHARAGTRLSRGPTALHQRSDL